MVEQLTNHADERSDLVPQTMLRQEPILTGHFRAGPAYGCRRPGGTADWLLFCIEQGAGRFSHRTGEFIARAGDLLLLPPRQRHDYHTAENSDQWTFTWVHFLPPPHWLPLLTWPQVAPAIFHVRPDPTAFTNVAQRLRDMHELATGRRHHRHALAFNALEETLLRLDEFNSESPAHRDERLDRRLRLAIDRCCRDLAHPWNIASLADIAGLSPSRFAHIFRTEMGETPRCYLERTRLERARQLLIGTELSVQEIANTVGFPDPFHFSKRFHALLGLAPTQARRPAANDSLPR